MKLNQSLKTLIIHIFCLFSSLVGQSQTFTLSDSLFNVGDEYNINNLRLGFDGDRLDDDSKLILDSVVKFLNSNPGIQVEFGNYSDIRGKVDANLKYSQVTAEWFVNYLITKGANAEQIIAKGYGESAPLFTEEELNNYRFTDKREYDRLHILNRRNILRIIKVGK